MIEIAKLFSSEDRKHILTENLISSAAPIQSNESMRKLGIYWKVYVEPDFKPECGLCLNRILNNYRQLQPYLIELEQNSNLLDAIS